MGLARASLGMGRPAPRCTSSTFRCHDGGMAIGFDEFSRKHSQLVHYAANGVDERRVAEAGLLSVTALLQTLADVSGRVKWRPLGQGDWREADWEELNRRPRGRDQLEVQGSDGRGGVLNDQGPLTLRGLTTLHERGRLLGGLNPGDWIAALNARVYFWADEAMRKTFRAKYERGGRLQAIVLVTAQMPESLRQKIRVSKINGGAINGFAERGPDTYAPLASVGFRLSQVKEITIEGRVTPAELRACGAGDWLRRLLAE